MRLMWALKYHEIKRILLILLCKDFVRRKQINNGPSILNWLMFPFSTGGYSRRVSAGKEVQVALRGILILIPSFFIMAYSYSALGIYISLALFSFGEFVYIFSTLL